MEREGELRWDRMSDGGEKTVRTVENRDIWKNNSSVVCGFVMNYSYSVKSRRGVGVQSCKLFYVSF